MSSLQPGQILGPYQIINQFGQGGMSTIYKAYHPAMDRYVAIKVLPHEFAQTKEFLTRFQQEARLIAKLEHPHILPVHDFGDNQGLPYLVMRFLDAGTLKERMQSGPLTSEEMDHLFTQLASALGYAHSKGVIHRDIKPSNALIDTHDNLFLTDFGIAKLIEGSSKLTKTGTITGTPDYMSPEQAQGDKVDHLSDIYSLGVVLYEMATGRVPYEAETPLAVLLKKIHDPLPPPSTIKPDIHPAIEAVILKALARNPEDRFASVQEFLTAWKTALAIQVETLKAPIPTPSVQPQEKPTAIQTPISEKPARPVLGARWAPTEVETSTIKKFIVDTIIYLPGLKGYIIAGVISLILLLILFSFFYISNKNFRFKNLFKSKATISVPIGTNVSTTANIISSTNIPTIPPQQASWTSWAAANNIRTISIQGNMILAGGPGGLTIWNREDNSLMSRYTTQNGLPGTYVTVIYIEADNNWWVGTDAGLVHIESKKTTLYNHIDGLDTDYISAITRYKDFLLVGTSYGASNGSGMNKFDGKTWKQIEGFPSTTEERPDTLSYNVNQILVGGNGNLWVATTSGLGYFDDQQWTILNIAKGLPNEQVNALMQDNDGNIWVGTAGGLVMLTGQEIKTVKELTEQGLDTIVGMVQDKQGQYWFTGDGGIVQYNPANGNWEIYNQNNSNLPAWSFSAATVDDAGILYFGSWQNGLVRYDGKFTVLAVPNMPYSPNFGRILQAPNGILWFMERDHPEMVNPFDPVKDRWLAPITTGDICCPVPMGWDASGSLWSGGDRLWIDNNIPINIQPNVNQVTAVAFMDGGIAYIGTDVGLFELKNRQISNFYNAANIGFASDLITTLFVAPDKTLWVGTEVGLSHLTSNNAWEHFHKNKEFGNEMERVTDIEADQQGNIWVSTIGDGVYRFLNGERQSYHATDADGGPPSNCVESIAVAPDDSLWFGTCESGAAHLKDGKWSTYTINEGLIHNTVYDVYVTPDGTAWFATGGGVSRYKP